MCEFAFYRLVLLEGTTADLAPLRLDVSSFKASVAARAAIDLRSPPFEAHRTVIASPTSYRASQALGRDMRGAGVEVFLYPCARALEGTNVGLFSPRAFKRKRPSVPQNWHCTASREFVEFTERDFFKRRSFRFERDGFLVLGRLPAPAL